MRVSVVIHERVSDDISEAESCILMFCANQPQSWYHLDSEHRRDSAKAPYEADVAVIYAEKYR